MGKNTSDEGWRKRLTAEQYRVLRLKGTEMPFCGALLREKREGRYYCAGCGALLFKSGAKFESGTGWPSFFSPAGKGAVKEERDGSLGMERVEIVCAKCGGHLGHVFNDGPPPTGKRYCMNSAALRFEEEKK